MSAIDSNAARTLIAQTGFGLAYVAAARYTRLSSLLSSFPMQWQATAFTISAIVQSLLAQHEEEKPVLSQWEKAFKYLSPFALIGITALAKKAPLKAGLIATAVLGIGQVMMSKISQK